MGSGSGRLGVLPPASVLWQLYDFVQLFSLGMFRRSSEIISVNYQHRVGSNLMVVAFLSSSSQHCIINNTDMTKE